MSDLAAFLLARIAEDEAVATLATSAPWQENESLAGGEDDWRIEDAQGRDIAGCPDCGVRASFDRPDADHIARHDPARVLAECEAKRRIVEEADGADAQWWEHRYLLALALPYADHPDYRDEWKP